MNKTTQWAILTIGAFLCCAVMGCSETTPGTPDLQRALEASVDVRRDAPREVLKDVMLDQNPLFAAVSQKNYEDDLTFIAKPRTPGSPHWKEVQDLCANRFASLGYSVALINYGSGVNVIGKKQGKKEPDKQILLSAHYDHIANCPGADDNGSGVAGVLEAARVLSTVDHDRSLIVACWDEEEYRPSSSEFLIGSTAYAKAAKAAGDQILMVYVFEMIGFANDAKDSQKLPDGFGQLFPNETAEIKANGSKGNFIALIYDQHPSGNSKAAADEMITTASVVGLEAHGLIVPLLLKNQDVIRDLRRSDHAPFWANDYPAMMITDTSNFRNPNYHCTGGQDTVDTLDHPFAVKVIQSTVGSVLAMLRSS